MSREFAFPDEPEPMRAFDAFKALRPEIKPALIRASRAIVEQYGTCDIHTAYGIAKALCGITCAREWLPAFAREIEAETELRFTKRPSRFDGMEALV